MVLSREKQLETMSQRQRKEWAKARDIETAYRKFRKKHRRNVTRHRRSRDSFRLFCESYFANSFGIAWSGDHLTVLGKIERAVLDGGLFALAMPRGNGKSTLCLAASLWALLYGHRRFLAIIAATEAHACEMLGNLRSVFEQEELLAADFPGAVFPVRALEGITHRANGQLWRGFRTHISWKSDQVILPQAPARIPGSEGCGATIRVAGLTGRIRGMNRRGPDGETMRPDFVILDDPQTDESAASIAQNRTRERIVAGAILGLCGPGAHMAGVMPCTVIRQGDMCDRVLDRERHPEWNGERMALVYSWPTNSELWEKYADMWRAGRDAETGMHDASDATAFYAANRAAMDEGASVAWEGRKRDGELSALQHAYNLRLEHGDEAFFSEYQNAPLSIDHDGAGEQLTAEEVGEKLSGMPRGGVGLSADMVTAFADVQGNSLWYVVVAWKRDFTGELIDYGVWPEQGASYVTVNEIRKTLQSTYGDLGLEGQIYAGLQDLSRFLLGTRYTCSDGSKLRIDRMMIDANWGMSTEVVYQFCQQSEFAALLTPSHGSGITARQNPMSKWRKARGERIGINWRMRRARRGLRSVIYDTNFWKTFVIGRLRTARGDKGSLLLYGRPGIGVDSHTMLIDHLTSEYAVRTGGRGREIDEWSLRPGRDNHLWDCLVGCAVAASVEGAALVIDGAAMDGGRRKRQPLAPGSDSERPRMSDAKERAAQERRRNASNRPRMSEVQRSRRRR
jgi:hypothetical protein